MRILFTLDSFHVGGTELHCLKAVRALTAAGHTVAVLVARPTGPLEAQFRAACPVFRYTITSLASPSLLSAIGQIRRVLADYRPDVVHALDKYSNVIVLPVARLSGIRRVIGSKRWLQYNPPVYQRLNRFGFRFAHAVTANGDAIGRTLTESEKVPAARVAVIRNIVAAEMLERPDDTWITETRRALGIADGQQVVGIVARMEAVKDHATFVRAMTSVLASHRDAVAVCVGDGSLLDSLRAMAAATAVADRILFPGYLPNVPNLNWLFDVAVLTSKAEGSPNSVIEALATGCPVVASRVGGLLDLADVGVPVTLCPVGDAEAFATAIAQYLDARDEHAALRDDRRETIRRRYSADAFVAASEVLYSAA